VVHRQYPHYTCLRKNCIFYASLIYDAAEWYGGSDTGNQLSRQGYWKGYKVSTIDPELVSKIVARFKCLLSRQISMVSLCSCSNYSH
jgi:hypothetical protein